MRRLLLLALGGCAATPSTLVRQETGDSGTTRVLTSWVDAAACAPFPTAQLWEPPQPWGPAPLLPAYDAYLDWLAESPNRSGESGVPQRIIDDLAVHDGSLYAGLGDWGFNTGSLYCHALRGACSHEDAEGHGIPILRWSPGSDGSPAVVALPHEEEIQRFRSLGGVLSAIGIDPSLGDGAPDCAAPDADPACPEEAAWAHPRFATGNTHLVYDDRVHSRDNLPEALHVFDMALHGDLLVAVGASATTDGEADDAGSHAAVWTSSDQGVQWTLHWRDASAAGKRRLTALVPVGDRLLAVGYHTTTSGNETFWLEISEAGAVEPSTAPLLAAYGYPAQAMPLDDETTLLWTKTSAARVAWVDGVLWGEPLALEAGLRVVDVWLLCRGDMLLLTFDAGRQEYRLYRTADLETFARLLVWPAEVSLAALAYWEGHLIFGATGDRLLRTP